MKLILPLHFFFYLNFISFNVAWSPLFIEMCRALVEQAPVGYVPPSSKKLRTTLLGKAKKEVEKSYNLLNQHGSHPVSVLFLMDGQMQHAIHSSISWCLPKMDRSS